MTGFGKASAELSDSRIVVEVKSLNSKQMDLNVRIPAAFRSIEMDLRAQVTHALERGKVDLTATVESISGAPVHARLNAAAIAQYKEQIESIADSTGLPRPADWFALLVRLPEVVTAETTEDASPAQIEAMTQTVGRALEALMQHRRAEGERLEAFFAARIAGIGELLDRVEPFEAERISRIRQRMQEALEKIPVAEYDKNRLEQEMIFYIEKLDVNEEKQRLRQHLRYFIETMEAPQGGQGKKLGFIAQEMGREINTLGSKSNHADMQALVVKMKDLLEQIKEQVLNVM